MKKILLPFLGIFLFVACENKKQVGTREVKDVITVTDNSITYSDTITHIVSSGGLIIPTESAVKNDPAITTEGTGTGRFAPKTQVNKAYFEDTLECSLSKAADYAIFSLWCDERSPLFPISMHIAARGPISGVGIYKAKGIETSATGNDTLSSFTEKFKDGQQYVVDSVIVNITKVASHLIKDNYNVQGSFQMWLTNASGSKTVTGTIDCNAVIIGNGPKGDTVASGK